MNEKELKKSLEEANISEQQYRSNMLNTLNRLSTFQLFKVCTKTLKDNPKLVVDLQIETGVGVITVNEILSIDMEFYEFIDPGITERIKKQKGE